MSDNGLRIFRFVFIGVFVSAACGGVSGSAVQGWTIALTYLLGGAVWGLWPAEKGARNDSART